MAKEIILIVEDEEDILEVISYNLVKEGYEVYGVTSGEEALRSVKMQVPDLILLDLMLPGMDGLDICRNLKQNSSTQDLPIMMLTAKSEDTDIVAGLELGADDYVVKPFSPSVLVARIRAVLRRRAMGPAAEGVAIQIKDLTIDPGRHEVLFRDRPVDLTFTEFRILHFLSRHPGWVYTRDQIIEAVRGDDYVVTDRAVDVQIAGLRKKLGIAGTYIETVRGVGYRFKE